MRRFRFAEEPLRRIKHQECRQAELRVGKAQQRVTRAQEELLGQMTMLEKSFQSATSDSNRLPAWLWCQTHASCQQQIAAAQQAVDESRKELLERVAELRKVQGELNALETLRDKKWREHRELSARESQIILDENALNQWMRSPADSPEVAIDD